MNAKATEERPEIETKKLTREVRSAGGASFKGPMEDMEEEYDEDDDLMSREFEINTISHQNNS